MQKSKLRILLISLLAFIMIVPQITFAKTYSTLNFDVSNWTADSTFSIKDGWLVAASPAGSPSGSDSGANINITPNPVYPEGCSFVYNVNFKTPSQPQDSSQSIWFRLAVGGNWWVNTFRVKSVPGEDILLDFASGDETRFTATAFDTSTGNLTIEYDNEYNMEITLKPSGVGKNVKFIAKLFDKNGEMLGAGLIENYSLINTDNLKSFLGPRIVCHRESKITSVEPAIFVGKASVRIDEPEGNLNAVFFPENQSTNANPRGLYYINFSDEIDDVELKDVSISNGAKIDSVNLTSGNKKLEFEISGLKPSTKYEVKINNINVRGTIKFYDYDWTFTTANQVSYQKEGLDLLFEDDLATVDFINFGSAASSSWPTSTDFLSGLVYSGRGNTTNTDSGDVMVRRDDNGVTFSTAKMKGTQWSGKSTTIRKTFGFGKLNENKPFRMKFDFKTGPKTDANFNVWYCSNNWKANPFAYNSRDCTITFASTNANSWEPVASTDGKTEFFLEEYTDYSLVMELNKNKTSGKIDALLTLYDKDGNSLTSALIENCPGYTNINSMVNFTVQSMINEDGSGSASVDYFTLKKITAEGVLDGESQMVAGDNTITVPWKNLIPEEDFTSTFVAVTELDDGTIEKVEIIKFEDVSGENGEHKITVNVGDPTGRKIKIYAVNDVEGMVPLSNLYEIN